MFFNNKFICSREPKWISAAAYRFFDFDYMNPQKKRLYELLTAKCIGSSRIYKHL
jgi:hypothetical protein